MDDTLLFIPPCCVDKKLPQAVTQAPQRMLVFYTHGDVTMEKFYRAISFLVIDAHVMALSMPTANNDSFVFLQQCFERRWISHLILTTANDCSKMVDKYLSDYKDKVLYTQSKDVTDVASHMVLYNYERAVVLTGLMTDRPYTANLVSYTLTFYPNFSLFSTKNDWSHPIRNVLFPDILRHRQQTHASLNKVQSPTLDHFLHFEFPPYK